MLTSGPQACAPQYTFCEIEFNTTTCSSGADCNDQDDVICNQDYDNCFYCADIDQCMEGALNFRQNHVTFSL